MPITTADGPSCFIAMPVTTSKAHADLYGDADHWNHVMESLFVPAIEAAGYVAWRPVAKGSHLIHAEIVRQLEQADMVLCDMSQNNPNVFFELGVRTSVNKPVALVRCDEETTIPFDVSGINTHTYDPSLKAWHIDDEVEKLADHLREAHASCAGENPMWRQFGMVLKAQEPTSGGSREEALLSVMSHQIDQLSNRVNAIAHQPNSVEAQRRLASERARSAGAIDLDDIIGLISVVAKNYDQTVDIWFEPNEGLVVKHLAPRDSATKRFQSAVQEELDQMGLGAPVRFAPYKPSEPNMP